MKRNGSQDHYIYFLNLGSGLPAEFIDLAQELKNWNIQLVPVSQNDLKGLAQSKKQFVVTITKSISDMIAMNNLRKNYLDYTLHNRKFALIDVSSFEKFKTFYKLAKLKTYFHIRLPLTTREVGRFIATSYFENQVDLSKWPGGRRATLPV